MGPLPYGAEPLDITDELEEEEDENKTVEVDEIDVQRAHIELTRAEMSDTIDAIKEKLSPDHLVQQAKETIHEATIGRAQEAVSNVMQTARDKVDHVGHRARETGSSLVETIRENPVPAAMIGIGIGWLVMSARKSTGRERYYRYESSPYRPAYGFDPQETYGYRPARYAEGPGPEFADPSIYRSQGMPAGYQARPHGAPIAEQARERVGEVAGEVRERVGEAAEQVRERVDEVRERAGYAAEQVRARVGATAERVRDRAEDLTDQARYQARMARYAAEERVERVSEGFDRTLEENPLALGIAAVALGAAVGLLLPETRYEQRTMGEARDRVVERVQEKAQDLGQKVQTVAREVMDTAKEVVKQTAQEQGLTGQEQKPTGQQQSSQPQAAAPAGGGKPLETVAEKTRDSEPAFEDETDTQESEAKPGRATRAAV